MAYYKRNGEYSYALGLSLVIELLKHQPAQISEVYLHSKLKEGLTKSELLTKLNQLKIAYKINDKIFNILSAKENCFVIGEFKKYTSQINVSHNHLVLVSPENAGNLGTIMRTALGFGFNDLIIIGNSVDYFDPKTIRASMGAVFALNINYFSDIDAYFTLTPHHHYYPFMLQTDNLLPFVTLKEPFSLMFGSESSGLDLSFLELGTPLRIPHLPLIDSLNLPNAVSIALYEAARKKQVVKAKKI